ncbi:MAG: hypothetical protein K5829_09455 [Treponema sp.]|nr:hypothetical protein [Treponema sp.]
MKKNIIAVFGVLLLVSQIFGAPSKVFMLREDGPLRVEEGSKGVKWATTVSAGTELELVSPEPIVKDLITTEKTYPNVAFYKVSYKDEIYYVQASEAALADTIGVICSDALLFLKASIATFRNAILEAGSIVAVEDKISKNGIDYAKVSFWDTEDRIVRSRFVEQAKVSESEKDVKAVMMITAAMGIKNEDLKNETLENAKKIQTSDMISDYITHTIESLSGENKEVEVKKEETKTSDNKKGQKTSATKSNLGDEK